MNVLLMTFLWAQRKLYEAFLKSELVDLAIQPKKSPLVDSAIQPKRSPLTAITVRSPSNLFFIVILFTFLGLHVFCSLGVFR